MARRVSRREFLRSLSLGAGLAVLAACGGAPATQEAPTQGTQTSPTAAPAGGSAPTAAAQSAGNAAAGGLPIVSSPLTLTYWVETSPTITVTRKSFAEITAYVEQEKRTGIHLDFQHPPTGPNQGREQFNLMIASGKYPDVIETNWLGSNPYYAGGPAKALKDGVIIRLNDLIDQYGPNLKKVLTDHPEWRKQVITDEGDIYCFPFLRGDPALLVFTGPVVRQDWLDKLNLKAPTTIDEWGAMLKTMKGQDLNGNGQADEWPFSPWLDSGIRIGFDISHAFVGAWGITTSFYQDGGTVKYGPLQPEYKEFLKTMADWYKQGYIDPDSVSFDQKAFDAKMTGQQLGSGIMRVGGGIGRFMGLMKDKDPKFKLAGTPYPTLKAGEKPQLGQRDNVFPGPGAAISSANQHVPETVKLLDFAYSDEGHMLFNFGKEGLTYTLENGYPKYTDLILKNPDKLPLAQAMAAHFRSSSSGPFVQDKRYVEQYFQLQEQKDAYKIWQEPTNEKLLPPITPTQDESRRFAKVMTEVNTRYDEVFSKVLTGAQPLDAWDGFVQELKQLGIDEAVQIQQAALDRFNKRA
jgi:putative aldouronate transport system substrate-binding protein